MRVIVINTNNSHLLLTRQLLTYEYKQTQCLMQALSPMWGGNQRIHLLWGAFH